MKILHLIHKNQRRGAEIFTAQLASIQKEKGHEVTIVAIYNGSNVLNYPDKINSLQASTKLRFVDLSAWNNLNKIVKKFKPDIIQANAGDTLKYAIFSKLVFRWEVPIIFRNASEVSRYITSKPQKEYNSFLLHRTNYVISVSQASKKDIKNNFPFLKDKIDVIPVGLEKNKIDEEFQLKPEEGLKIIHVGGFTFEKNHEALLRIFEKVTNKLPSAHLHLIGDGPLKRKIKKLVTKAGLNSKIHFHGFVNNPLSFIQAADVLVLPSIIEGLPGVLLEAMYCKTPVIAYNVGGISEIVTENTGTLINKDDEENFAKAIIDNLISSNTPQIENAYQMVKEKFMNEKIAQDFLSLYKKILRDSK